MRIEVLTSQVVSDAVEFFPEFTVSLEKGGLRLRGKSPIFAEYIHSFKKQQGFRKAGQPWEKFPLEVVPNLLGDYVFLGNGVYIRQDGELTPNLIWLFHKDLATGFDLTVADPVGLNDLQQYFQDACQLLQEIYVTSIRTAEYSAVLKEILNGANARA
jgi:hypothetical protein